MSVFHLKLTKAQTSIALVFGVFALTACGGGSNVNLDTPGQPTSWPGRNSEQQVKSGAFSVVAVDDLGQEIEAATNHLTLRVEPRGQGQTVWVSNTGDYAARSLYLHLKYDETESHPIGFTVAQSVADTALVVGITEVPGVIYVGIALVGEANSLSSPDSLLQVRFGNGPMALAKRPATVAETAVVDLRFGFTNHEMLTWSYTSTGDYDQNSEVNVADITPIALFYHATQGDPDWVAARVVDGDGNREINTSDITPIVLNFRKTINAYRIKSGPSSLGPFGAITDGDVPRTEATLPAQGGFLRFEETLANTVEGAYYIVVALDEVEEAGTISNVAQYTGVAAEANPPQNLVVTVPADTFHLEWDPPLGSIPEGYNVYVAESESLLSLSPPIGNGVFGTSFNMPSYISTASELYFGVKADYGGTLSDFSNVVHYTPGGGGDGPIWELAGQGIKDVFPGNGQVAMEWYNATDDNNPPVEYLIFYAPSSTGIDWDTHQETQASGLSRVIDGLSNGTSYDFGVRAMNNLGISTTNTNFMDTTPTDTGGVPFDTGVWQPSELVDDGGDPVQHDIGWFSDIEVADDGSIGIVHYNFSTLDLMYTHGTPGNWTTETVTNEGDVGLFPDLEYNPVDGRPCIAYHNGGEKTLEYAQFNGTTWDIETVDSGGDRGAYCSLTFDPADDNPAISYWDLVGQDCRYAKWTGTDWDTEIVYNGVPGGFELTGKYTSLAFNPVTGNPGVSFMRTWNPGGLPMEALWYAEYSGSSWSAEEADLGAVGDLDIGTAGFNSSICFSPTGVPHILHGDITGEVRLTHKSGGFWQTATVGSTDFEQDSEYFDTDIEWYGDSSYWVHYDTMGRSVYFGTGLSFGTVVESGNIGGTPALDVDADGTIHLSYTDISNRQLRYTVGDGSNWTSEVAHGGSSGAPYVGERASLGFEPTSGYPMVSYYDVSGRALKYADKQGGSWRNEIVSSGNFDGAYNAMGVDDTGETYIAYFTVNTSTGISGLHVAKGFYGSWDMTTIQEGDGDTGGDVVGQYLALNMNFSPDNFPGISYYNKSSERLEYALGSSGDSYEQTTVDNFGNAGRWSSTAFNPANGNPGIAYYRSSSGDLFFSERAGGGTWTPEPVDTVQDSGNRCAMTYVTDYIATVEPWISYYDATNKKLKVAYNDGSGWQFVTVPAPGASADYGSYSSIANHPVHARAAVVFYDKYNGKLWYMFIGDPDNPQAAVEIAGAEIVEGTFPSLVFNPLDNQPGVAYQDGTNGDLRYVWREGI